MPSKESLLEGDPPAKGKQLQKLQEREDERIRLLSEWEAEVSHFLGARSRVRTVQRNATVHR